MAARGCVCLAVCDIPRALRSADLRNYFSQFTESGGFACFHYRHRPQPQAPGRTRSRAQAAAASSSSCCCCVVSLPAHRASAFIDMYSGRQWVDRAGSWLRSRCLVRRVRAAEAADLNLFPYKTKLELQNKKAQSEIFTQHDLSRLPELNPPALMPNGNVGTPVRVFLELIQACRLPPRIITKLDLKFPKTSSNRRYGNVPFQYETSELLEQEESIYTATGEEISGRSTSFFPLWHNDKREEVENGHLPDSIEQEEEKGAEPHSDNDEDSCEEWERHEALHEDVTTQERTKERLFEEEIELKWEKGGSGLVFYTDAQYWQQEEGDFDEETADDWDVDMSVYYDKGGGDKDSRDYVQMRLEQRLREGLESGSVQTLRIGSFEKYTKGFGRKEMEKQGWTEGLGLGSSSSGMADALENDGQHPKCKRGLGYHGEKLQRYQPAKRLRRETSHIISTIYDQPESIDQGDTLLRRQPVTSMKYREDVAFVKGSHVTHHSVAL
uniref:G patch domain containing 3 n=1 Tax=Callorhinchus milii TaxID=7868 RepID=A0A4W3K3S7_CALMI|eukprot:gi/632954751/ref/XP_007893127.1/ PREDICTED: G patch domain-containing protein 3 [Callorhinchus milii]